MNACERRKAIRFEGEIPVRIKQGMGTTRNFSTDGVYFVTEQPLSIGEQVEFIMQLCHSGLKQDVQLHCQGEVLRVEPEAEKSGIAIEFQNIAVNGHQIRPGADDQLWEGVNR